VCLRPFFTVFIESCEEQASGFHSLPQTVIVESVPPGYLAKPGTAPFRVLRCPPEGTLMVDVLFDPGPRFRNGLLGTLSVTDVVPVPIHALVRLVPFDLGACAGLGFQISAFHFEAPVALGRPRAPASKLIWRLSSFPLYEEIDDTLMSRMSTLSSTPQIS